MSKIIKKYKLHLLVLVGLLLRLSIQVLGYNYDFESFTIVGKLVSEGKNVYAHTHRYNYGPVWFLILGVLYKFSLTFTNSPYNPIYIYRTLIIIILTLADGLIALWLYKNFGKKSALWFWLNPISIYITGWHNQFDNLAIATGLWALEFLSTTKTLALSLLGISLSIKHIFFVFPLWLIPRYKNAKRKVLMILPYFIFSILFLPFSTSQKAIQGIIENVIFYSSNYPGIYPIPKDIKILIPFSFIAILFLIGIKQREKNLKKLPLLYLAYFTALLPIAAWQYFSIPLAFYAAFSPNYIGNFYTVLVLLSFPIYGQILSTKVTGYLAYGYLLLSLLFINKLNKRKESLLKLFKFLNFFLILILLAKTMEIGNKTLKEEIKQKGIIKEFIHISKVFKNQIDYQPLFRGKVVKGEFSPNKNGLGAVYLPYILVNPSGKKFFTPKNKYEVSLWEGDKLYFKEIRPISAGLTYDGLAFGFPPILNSKDKIYTLKLKTNIPPGKDYFYLDRYGRIQFQYLAQPNLKTPSGILSFVSAKLSFLFFHNKEFQRVLFMTVFIFLIFDLLQNL